MAEKKYLDLTGLGQYDAKIKEFIESKVNEGDAKSFKYVNLEDGVLKFYTVNPITEDTVADFEIELPEQDLSHLMALVEDAVEGNVAAFDANGQVVDSGVKAAEIATKAEVKEVADKATANEGAITAIKEDLGNVDGLSTTNKTVAGAINEVLAAVGTGGTAAVVTVTSDTTTEGAVMNAMSTLQASRTDKQKALISLYGTANLAGNLYGAPWMGNTNKDTKSRIDMYISGDAGYINNAWVDYSLKYNYIKNDSAGKGLEKYIYLNYYKDRIFKETFSQYAYEGDTLTTEDDELETLTGSQQISTKIIITYQLLPDN